MNDYNNGHVPGGPPSGADRPGAAHVSGVEDVERVRRDRHHHVHQRGNAGRYRRGPAHRQAVLGWRGAPCGGADRLRCLRGPALRPGRLLGAGCSARLWKTISLNSCWCSSSPFCWVWPSGPSMICCGPSASGCPGWPRCWTAYMPWPWGAGCFRFILARAEGELRGFVVLRVVGGAVLFFSAFSSLLRPVWEILGGYPGLSGPLPDLSPSSGEKFLKKCGRCGKISFILQANAIQ